MTELPQGWALVRLNDVADVKLGRQRSPKNHSGDRMRPYLRAANVTWSGLNLSDVKEMAFTEAESRTFELRDGDVLVSEASGSASEVGKAAIWRGQIAGCCFQNTLLQVRSRGPEPEYLRYFLYSEALAGKFGDRSRGVGIHHIGAGALSSWPVPVAPFAEQRRIVEAIEEHLSKLDAAEAALRRVVVGARRMRAAVMTSAVAGIPRSVRIGEVATVGSGATPKKDRPDYWENGSIPWVTSGQLSSGDVTAPTALITEKALRETSVKVWPRGTLLVAMYGEGRTRGTCAELGIDATTNQACAAIAVDQHRVDRHFLRLFLNATYEQNRRLASGGVQPNLSLGLIKNMEIPLPGLDDQRKIVAEVDECLSIVDAVEASIERASARADTLRRSILSTAFSGQLLPR